MSGHAARPDGDSSASVNAALCVTPRNSLDPDSTSSCSDSCPIRASKDICKDTIEVGLVAGRDPWHRDTNPLRKTSKCSSFYLGIIVESVRIPLIQWSPIHIHPFQKQDHLARLCPLSAMLKLFGV
jgi:hypothetical protein